jgi:acetolactate synthase I/II/III large subunit
MKQNFETTAEAFLELLHLRGIKYFLANAGTDFASIVDAFAHRRSQGQKWPKPLVIPHEGPLVAMAHGYYLATGEPLAAMVHVGAGTANSLGALMNAYNAQVPILFAAGRTPISEWGHAGSRSIYIHWGQECYDQAGIVREFVKWDYELRSESDLEAVVDRGLTLAMSEPRGPVYLTLPRETLAAPFTKPEFKAKRRYDCPTFHPRPEKLKEAAEIIAGAKFPLVITSAAGKDPQAVVALTRLADSIGCGVISFNPEFLNFPLDHPAHLGFEIEPDILEADVIIVLDCDVPWYPQHFRPKQTTKVIHIAIDPLYSNYPIRTFESDLSLAGDARQILTVLCEILAEHPECEQAAIADRKKRIKKRHLLMVEKLDKNAQHCTQDKPIDPVWAAHCLNKYLNDDTIVVNEYDNQMKSQANLRPGRYFTQPHGGFLGFGFGAALGIKLASPDKTVILTVGDGSYLFNVPSACHLVSKAQQLPILIIVFNNHSWNAVKRSNLGMHPDGWAAKTQDFPLCDLQPSMPYEKICEAFGGYGEKVEDPGQLQPAIERGLNVVRQEKRQALINIILKHP